MASKRTKGLSVDEKRKRMAEIFYETQDFFQLKELEKIAPKNKGIVVQSVKEILQSLIDDNLVTCEKIGTSNYYWAFPSQALNIRKTKVAQMGDELQRLKRQKIDLQEQIEKEKSGREESDDRTRLLQELAKAEALRQNNINELAKFREMDPTLLAAKEKAAIEAKTAANRWTDNIFSAQSHCVNTFNMSRQQFCEVFQIPEDFDYVE